jgi:hypothetical protein
MQKRVIGCLALALAACGGDHSPAKPSGGDSDSAGAAVRANLSPDEFEELSKRTLEGWEVKGARATDKSARVTLTREAPTSQGLALNVIVKIGICPDDLALCYSTDPGNPGNKMWAQQARDSMAKQNAKDAIAHIGAVELQDGRQALGLYRAGRAGTADGKGTGTTLGMDVRYCDGANAILMTITVSGEKKASNSEELSAYLSRSDATAAAREVFALYADKF